MFIIDKGCAYFVKGKVAHKIKFNPDMTYTLTDETLEDISKYVRYTLREIKAKLNVKHNLQKYLISKAGSDNSAELAELKKELEEANALIEELKKELEIKEQEIAELNKVASEKQDTENNEEPEKENKKEK